MQPKDRLIVALDFPDLKSAMSMVESLTPEVSFFKVGLELFTAEGAAAVKAIKAAGGRVFLDLKLHDIPNTVARTAAVLAGLGVDMFNVHAAGGRAMMKAAAEAVAKATAEAREAAAGSGCQVIAVTVLTSLDDAALRDEVGLARPLPEVVAGWCGLALQSGLQGVVASAQEAAMLRARFGPAAVLVTPGIRPAGEGMQDHSRVVTPAKALKNGSTYIVVGRPITAAGQPREAARRIIAEMEGI